MRGMPLNPQGEEGSFYYSSKKRSRFEGFSAEPISVLDSPPTSSSTLSSSPLVAGGGGGGSSSSAAGVEDWETMLSDSPALSPIKDQTFLQWVMTDTDPDPSQAPMGFDFPGFGLVDPQFQFDPIIPPPPPPSSAAGKVATFGDPSNSLFYQHHPIEEEDNPLVFPPGLAFNQNPVNPLPYNLQHRPNMPRLFTGDESAMAAAQQQQQALIDNLFMAAELIEAGNSVTARGILSRLNHQLLSPIGKKPLLRSAFYFNAALLRLLADPTVGPSSPPATLLEVVLKLGAYKAFSEASPALQFTNFTSIQTILEELDGSDRIHVLDFDIGIGGQWSSFMQELAQRRSSVGTVPSLKITAFASHRSHHPLELHLTRENLSHFARNLNIPFEFNALSLDSSDPSSLLRLFAGVDEAVAVNLPVGSTHGLPLPAVLSLVKQISPKIVVSVDNGLDRSELPFSRRFIHSLQSSTVLLDSIDSTGTNPDVANKIERFILQPRIESSLTGRHRDPSTMIPWRTIFTSAGLIPMQFSNFTETQAECLLKRVQVRGFHVEKRQASLFLCWQRGELVSVSAWRC